MVKVYCINFMPSYQRIVTDCSQQKFYLQTNAAYFDREYLLFFCLSAVDR